MLNQKPETKEPVEWVQLSEAYASLEAEVVAGLLRAEGVPVWIWQQGAGRALGLTVGPMGNAHIMVPAEYVEIAHSILAAEPESIPEAEETFTDETELSEDEEPDWLEKVEKGILGVTAVALSPLGAMTALLVSQFSNDSDDTDPDATVICPACGVSLDLDTQEIEQGWYICPECEQTSQV